MGWKNSSSRFSSAARVDARDQCHLAMAAGHTIRVVNVNAVTTAVFRRVTGDIGSAHHRRDVLRAAIDLDDTDARAHRERTRAPYEAVVADRLTRALRDARRLVERAAFEQHTELVTTETRDGVGRADAGLKQTCDVSQEPVASPVTRRCR